MKGIPTTHRETRFRSRLEARWAFFFDAIGWSWEYEPFDVGGYVPDFAILGDNPLLVEVKPGLNLSELNDHVAKAETADRDLLIVGASPVLPSEWGWGYPVAGILLQWQEPWEEAARTCWAEEGCWHRCAACKQVSVHHSTGIFTGYPCGHYDGDHFLNPILSSEIEAGWAASRNATQWNPR